MFVRLHYIYVLYEFTVNMFRPVIFCKLLQFFNFHIFSYEESDDVVILGVTFVSKMTFEKHLRSVSRAAFQRLGILGKSWLVFHDGSLLGR